jgi:mono/diheme cytochrome c family protein
VSSKSLWSIVAVSVYGICALGTSEAADVENGRRLAERWCASCHAVSATQKSASTDAPPFSGIASRPALDAGALALFLLHPHPKMPDVGLSRDAAADLAAYIARQPQ